VSGENGNSRGLDRERIGLEIRRAAKPFAVLVAFLAASFAAWSVIIGNIGLSWPWSNSYETRVALDDASGVVPQGQAVRLAGIEVGLITGLEVEDGQAIATIRLGEEHGPLYKDARLRLRPETPLDDIYLDVEKRGTPAAGELGKDDVLPAGRTQVAVDIGRVLNVFSADTRTRVEQAVDEYGRGLGDGGDDFRNALVQLAPFLEAAKRLTHESAIRRRQTARVIHNLRLMTEELAKRQWDLRVLVRGGAGALGELGRAESSVQETLVELPPTLRRLQTSFATLRATADELDPAFDALQPVARELPSGLEGLRRLGVRAAPSLHALRRPLPSLRALVHELRPTAGGLNESFSELLPVPGRLDRFTALTPPCFPALAKFFHNTNSLGKFADRNSVILRGQAVLGLNSLGGQVDDPNQNAAPSCVPGGPSG
jgi:phospholipid/cholesterol/gamma-HCH transport system substrate-binding protein